MEFRAARLEHAGAPEHIGPPPVSELAIPKKHQKAWQRMAKPETRSGRSSHPLEQRVAARRALGRQLGVSLAVLAGVLIATTLTGRASAPLTVGATLASCVFALLVVVTTVSTNQEAIDAIARGEVSIVAGCAPGRITALASRRNRRALARTLCLCLTAQRRNDAFTPARATLRGDADLRPRLSRIIRQLEDEGNVSTVAVALVHQLITDAGSPLYAGTPDDLRRSLGRIGYLLAAGDCRCDRTG